MGQPRALVFTDLVDSTAWTERIGDQLAARLWAQHDEHARELLGLHNGQEIDRSDGFFALFEHVRDAAAFAVAYHRLVASIGLSARAAVHFGVVTLRRSAPQHVARGAKPVEVDGIAKPTAARLLALAPGGRTLFSADAADQLGDLTIEGQRLRSQGHYRLKGLPDPVQVFELADSTAAGPPPVDTDKAYRVQRIGELWRPVQDVRHNLAPERDAFVGRRAELRALAEQLDAGARLVTVLGPGGTGKTRLVLRYATAWRGDWPGGVYFCDLSEARSLEGIHFAVAHALDVPLSKDDAGVQLGHAIAGRGRCLIVLDNFEQVQAHAGDSVGRWVDGAPDATFVVTSRERLHVPGEAAFSLEPMELGSDAMSLFEVRAQSQQPSFMIDKANRAQIAHIVQMLDGLPLAVELAAARTRVLSPAQIIERMTDRFALLAGTRGPGARQATLQQAIDWSWSLLAPWEQSALAQCSVFDGSFTLEAAEGVLDLSPHGIAVIDVVQSLVDKSLLRTWLPPTARLFGVATPFLGMYISIHAYAAKRLAAYGDTVRQQAEVRHGQYFARFGSDEAQAALLRQGGVARRHALALALDNLVAASKRAIARVDPDVAVGAFMGAWAVFEARGPFSAAAALGAGVMSLQGLSSHQRVLAALATAGALDTLGRVEAADAMLADALEMARQATEPLDEAMVHHRVAVAFHRHGDSADAHPHFEAALAAYERLNDRARQGVLLSNLANLQMDTGRIAEARASYERALALHREVGNRAAEGIAQGSLGTLLYDLGHREEAQQAYEQALAIHREAGSRLQEAITLYNMGLLFAHDSNAESAFVHYRDALAIHRETGNRRGEGVVLGSMGHLHHKLAQFEEARDLYEQALRIHREIGNQRFEAGTEANIAMLLTLQGDLDLALQALERSERLLRQLKAMLTVALVTCMKGEVFVKKGEMENARAALTEAERIAAELGAQPDSEIGRGVQDLRRSLGV